MELVKYEAACRAVSQAKTIDEVKEISNRAEAMRAYARQAQNRNLEIDAMEIRVRAERRLGELLLVLRREGLMGQGRGGSPVTLDSIGVSHSISGGAQRLAKLPEPRFETEIGDWRRRAETSSRMEMPLQRYRKPSIVRDRQVAAARNGSLHINQHDLLDRFRATDGRRIADWRRGELQRIKELAQRMVACVNLLSEHLPIADELDTMEMMFDHQQLADLLASVWEVTKVQPGATGVDSVRIETSRVARMRVCEHCGKEFTMRRLGDSQGRFCSRSCIRRPQKMSCGT